MKIYVLILLLGTIAAFAHMSVLPEPTADRERLT